MTQKKLAVILLVGSLLTLAWTCVCPRYRLSGHTMTLTAPSAVFDEPHAQPTAYWHADPAKFAGGLVVIWSGVFGVGLLMPLKNGLFKGDSL